MQKPINVISLSGGKDSTALWLYALEQGVELMPVFADTGNEHEKTYEYIDYLERQLGPIRRIKADFTEQIDNRRQYVTNCWPDKLQKDVPGKWIRDHDVSHDDPTEGVDTPPECEPNDPQKEYKGVYGWVWKPGVKGMSFIESQETINRVLEALIPTGNPFLDLCMWKGGFHQQRLGFAR